MQLNYSVWITVTGSIPDVLYVKQAARPNDLTLMLSAVGTNLPFKDEARTALFKDPVRTAQ